jgi:hypothetical protein
LTLDLGKLDSHRRVVNAPGIGVSVQEMLDALSAVAGPEKLVSLFPHPTPLPHLSPFPLTYWVKLVHAPFFLPCVRAVSIALNANEDVVGGMGLIG